MKSQSRVYFQAFQLGLFHNLAAIFGANREFTTGDFIQQKASFSHPNKLYKDWLRSIGGLSRWYNLWSYNDRIMRQLNRMVKKGMLTRRKEPRGKRYIYKYKVNMNYYEG